MTKKLYLDTEFNGLGGELLSIALVTKDAGQSFYAVIKHDPTNFDPWVAQNVIPVLRQEPESLAYAQARLRQWLFQFEGVHIIADWPDDIAYFCRMLITGPGERLNTPNLTFEIRRDLHSEGSRIPHNALHDAWAIASMDA